MKDKVHPYRGIRKRLDRKKEHIEKADFERLMFVLKQHKRIVMWGKDVKDDHTPTKYIVVEFNLKDAITISDFEELLYQEMGLLL
ncbi:hypothetical protein ES702_00725 [subsurface metagenome]